MSFGTTQEVEYDDSIDGTMTPCSEPPVQEMEDISDILDEFDDDNWLSEVLARADRRKLRRSVTVNVGLLEGRPLPDVENSKLWQRRLSLSNEHASK